MGKIDVISIESGVDIPQEVSKGRPSVWPIDQLDVGDSFAFSANYRQTLASAVSRKKAATGKEFTIRKQDDDSYRLWRTK